jgi:hypothetical protein
MTRVAALLIAIIVAVALPGCAGHGTQVSGGASPLPEWVRMVHPTADGRDIYVGGCSMAAGPAESVELARADVFSQITRKSRTDFTRVFSGAIRGSGIELTSIDRVEFKERGLESYAGHLIEAARLDRVYFEDCETGRAYDGFPDRWVGGPVCRTFVELSLDAADWGRMLEETVFEMRHEFAKSGRDNLVELADWVIANYETPEREPKTKPNADRDER